MVTSKNLEKYQTVYRGAQEYSQMNPLIRGGLEDWLPGKKAMFGPTFSIHEFCICLLYSE